MRDYYDICPTSVGPTSELCRSCYGDESEVSLCLLLVIPGYIAHDLIVHQAGVEGGEEGGAGGVGFRVEKP